MARKEPVQERKICVIIRSEDKRKPVVLETWRYWDIVGELLWIGADYPQAVDAAKWAQRAKPGEWLTIGNVVMEVKDG